MKDVSWPVVIALVMCAILGSLLVVGFFTPNLTATVLAATGIGVILAILSFKDK